MVSLLKILFVLTYCVHRGSSVASCCIDRPVHLQLLTGKESNRPKREMITAVRFSEAKGEAQSTFHRSGPPVDPCNLLFRDFALI